MATLSIEIPNPVAARLMNAIAAQNGYQETVNIGTEEVPEIVPNPQSKAEFAKQWVILQLKHQVRHYESQIAGRDAAQVAADAVDNDIELT